MKRFILALIGVLFMISAVAQKNVYGFKAKDANGRVVKLKEYKGKVLLIVNTATKCGFTPVILDFPCNQFGAQAPGTMSEIRAFCTGNYGITFPQFEKIDVNGNKELPLYTYLKAQQGFKGFDTNNQIGKYLDEKFSKQNPNYAKDPSIKWNFTKFLIDREGHVVDRFEPTADMKDVEAGIRAVLKIK